VIAESPEATGTKAIVDEARRALSAPGR
jgi:hypothetical protein